MKILLLALVKMCICIAFGAGFGWFVSNEWLKHCKKDEWKQVEVAEKKVVTSNDIPILDWRGK